jgi:hypothetical protein
VHTSLHEIYALVELCVAENLATVFYPGEWPTQGNGTLPGRDGGSEAGNVSPHVTASGALAQFASSLDEFGIDLVLVYDDDSWLATPATATARAAEIRAYNASAGAGEEVDGALLSFDISPTPTEGADLCDLVASFENALTNAATLAATFPAFEAVDVTWQSATYPLAEQCLRAAGGVVHHVRRTELQGPDSVLVPLTALLSRAEALGLDDAVWGALDCTDRVSAGGSASETFFGRTRAEYLEAYQRIQEGLDPEGDSAGPVILDWSGFEALDE